MIGYIILFFVFMLGLCLFAHVTCYDCKVCKLKKQITKILNDGTDSLSINDVINLTGSKNVDVCQAFAELRKEGTVDGGLCSRNGVVEVHSISDLIYKYRLVQSD